MEDRVAGVRVRKPWDDAVAHGDRIARASWESDVDAVAHDEWEDWRAKVQQELREPDRRAGRAALERASGRAHDHAARAVDTNGGTAIRTIETSIHERFVPRFTPYYGDDELVTVNSRRRRGWKPVPSSSSKRPSTTTNSSEQSASEATVRTEPDRSPHDTE